MCKVPRSCRNAAGLKVAAAVMSSIFSTFCCSPLWALAQLSCNFMVKKHSRVFVQAGLVSLLAC